MIFNRLVFFAKVRANILLDLKRFVLYNRFSSSGITVRIGCASGFWGDTATAVPQLVHNGKLDFLVFDYLSELTMSLLAAAKQKAPELGYTPDFVFAAMAPNLKEIKERNIRVVSNAGGINPHGCAHALRELSKKLGLDIKIAVVTGDDLMPQKKMLEGLGIKDMKEDFLLPENIHSVNAYLGAGPIAKALDDGAEIVVTGRCVDSALALGPLISTFKWESNEWDKLASGSLAGHLIECGAQSTGGIFTDWHLVPELYKIGFPIVECEGSGRFTISKPHDTGGIVTKGTVAEQLLYEIGDPKCYLLPDVTCDFSNVTLFELSKNVVLVEGAKGKPPSSNYKVSATCSDGFRTTAVCPIIGPRAVDKANKTAEAVLTRTRMVMSYFELEDFKRVHLEILGSEQSYGKHAKAQNQSSREVVMWLAVHHDEKKAIDIFSREIAASGTGGAPGFTAMVGGRPKVTPVLKLFSFLYPKNKVKIQITSDNKTEDFCVPEVKNGTIPFSQEGTEYEEKHYENELLSGQNKYSLKDLAYTRSGDKGNTCNIGVIARHPSFFPYIEKQLTADAVNKYFEHVFDNEDPNHVKRYILPGIHAFNFVLEDSLGGGGAASLRSDPLGKAFGQVLSDFVFVNMPNLDVLKG